MAESGDVEKVSSAMGNVKVSVQGVEEEGEVKKKTDRHCSFCLTLVPGAEVKHCGKCKRRAYCSKECQTADWKSPKEKPAFNGKIHGYGQGHKNWCGLPYGEEDLDWKVAPISGKGLGLVALRDLPPLYRIVVEGMQDVPVLRSEGSFSPYHPGMDDFVLVPGRSDTLPDKVKSNAIKTEFGAKIGLRFSRTNHSCDANAFQADDQEFGVLVISSSREIKEGEEICISYYPFNDIALRVEYREKPPEFFRTMLSEVWGITCPPSCPCRDLEKVEMLEKARKLYWECERDHKKKNVLPKIQKVIEIAACSGYTMSNLNLQGRAAEFAHSSLETKKSNEHFATYLKAFKAIYHPNSKNAKGMENRLKEDL